MIQVLQRTAKILERLAEQEDISLKNLAEIDHLNLGTICNILRTLIELGWVKKNNWGCYCLNPRVRDIFGDSKQNPQILDYLNSKAQQLSNSLKESIVISTLVGIRVSILALAQYQHTIMINDERLYAHLSLYTSVSGELLMASLPEKTRQALYETIPPTPQDLVKSEGSLEKYEQRMGKIRLDGMNISYNTPLGIKSWALPIQAADDKICACLGLSVPLVRLPQDEGEDLQKKLQLAAKEISQWFHNHEIKACNIMRLPLTVS